MSDLKNKLLASITQLKKNIVLQINQGDNVIPFFQTKKTMVVHQHIIPETEKDAFQQLFAQVQKCRQCHLAESRRNVVFGEGNASAKLVFVGEAPGLAEDKSGRPFVDEAGALLTKIIESIGLKREEVYICNVLKCRPPGNRNPSPEEMEACKGFLETQLALVKPDVICALGAFAGQTLLATKDTIAKLREREHNYKGIPVVPTYHPAALLYHPQNKKFVWQDMKRIAALLRTKAMSK